MIDLKFTHGSLTLVLYCFILFAILAIKNYSICSNVLASYNYSAIRRKGFLWGVGLFSVTCFVNGDFYNYESLVHNYDFSANAINHGEPVYKYIILFLNRNYLLFRIVLWGGALFLFSRCITILGLEDYKVVYYMFTSYILTFSYARATLAMSIYFLGIVMLCTHINRSLIIKILGIILIPCSFFFHNSMIILITITPIIFFPLNRKTFFLTLLLIPAIFIVFTDIWTNIISDNFFLENEKLYDQISMYAERTTKEINWKGKLYEWSNYLTYFIPILILSYNVYFKGHNKLPSYIESFFKLALTLALIAVMFLFLNIEGKVFFYRILFMSFIPLSIVAYYAASCNIINRKTYIAMINIGLLAQLYRFFYSLYLYI